MMKGLCRKCQLLFWLFNYYIVRGLDRHRLTWQTMTPENSVNTFTSPQDIEVAFNIPHFNLWALMQQEQVISGAMKKN